MSDTQKNLKAILSSRVNPFLKFTIKEEADKKGITVSHYLEQILKKRHTIPDDNALELEDTLFETENQLMDVTIERDQLIDLLEEFRNDPKSGHELNKKLKTYEEKNNLIQQKISSLQQTGIFFDQIQQSNFNNLINSLKNDSTNTSANDLILKSLTNMAKQNQDNFNSKNVKQSFFQRHPFLKKLLPIALLFLVGRIIWHFHSKAKKKNQQMITSNIPSQNNQQNYFKNGANQFYR